MHVSDTKCKIDCNTVCVYASFPNYPYGTVDPIDKIARICKSKGVPLHVDMCLGGFIVPFLKN
jgi:glutamate/tyrosine decarboxylase-like PLP-dependent enzyme